MLLLIPLFVLAAVCGAALTLWLGRSRSKHDRRVPASSPVGGAKDGLRAALATARIGEWSWNDATGEVIWDENVATLCGIDRSQSAHDLDGWLALIHHDDRAMFMETLTRSVVAREPIRLDLRCDWADGSVHWLEVVGDVSDTAIGAFGLVIDVDDRHLEIQERTRLIEFERRQRRRVEYLASVNDVLTLSVDTDEILDRITQSVILEHADWCSITLAIDRPRTRPSIRVSHRDPAMVLWAKEVQLSYPYDPDARWGAARVIATKRREFIPRIDQGAFALQGGEVLAKSGAASVVTVPLVGAVGTLGALQLIRSADVPAFTAADLEFIDDLASRLGAALNTAVLFERQSRGRAA
ncbi:MAG: PAS domain-containing protein, partial [Ilumatobacteraceae bacterium]